LRPTVVANWLELQGHEMNILSRPGVAIGSRDRRVHRRYLYPALRLEIDGKRYKTTDWSLGGFRINGYHEALAVGDRLTGQITPINSSGPGTFVAEVVRIAETGEIGLRLLEITPAVFITMAGFKDY